MSLAQYSVGVVGAFLLSYAHTFAQDTTWIDNVADESLDLLGVVVIFLSGLAVAVFLWGLTMFVGSSGDEQGRSVGRKRMIWGILGLFVLVSLWGIVQLAQGITNIGSETVDEPGVTL